MMGEVSSVRTYLSEPGDTMRWLDRGAVYLLGCMEKQVRRHAHGGQHAIALTRLSCCIS
jgi:hypothetical protein